MSARWLVATRSVGKLREIRPLLAAIGVRAIDLNEAGLVASADEDDIECHDTFEANALAKAEHFAARSDGLPVVADDSGLEVFALGGEPGVRSKRWSGQSDLGGARLDAANNALLLDRLRGGSDRGARFVCAAAWCQAERSFVARGELSGRIVETGAGDEGFGYDPFFFVDELGTTLGSVSVSTKQRVSHRGRAFRALLQRLASPA